MIALLFAHIYAIRVAAHQFQNAIRHQSVMQDNISLLHQTQRAKCQQVRITGATSNQINFPHRHQVIAPLGRL